jgi:muramoyltetrapeptide carboxypeptidase
MLRAQTAPRDEPPASSDTLRSPTGRRAEPRRSRRAAAEGSRQREPLIKPPALTEGSTIGIAAPASGVSRGDVLDAAATLRNLGFNVKIGEHVGKGFGYLAAQDQERADDYMRFVRDPEVDCVMAVRGGYGVMRILPLLDFETIRANPKIHIGYSDITGLVNPIYQHAGLVAFHGPVATSGFDPYTLDSFKRVLMSTGKPGAFGDSTEFNGSSFSESRARAIVRGKAQGRLVGGNLSLVVGLMGTKWEIDTTDNILFLEEVNEEPFRVDRMMTQLAISGKLGACAGVALGRFTKCEAPARGGELGLSLSLEQVIRGILEPLGIPTLYGLSIGHIRSKLTIPVGGLATLDADAKTLTIDEPAVS